MTSLCGPSNALSSLQKHSSADRSLQQDRSRQSPKSIVFRTGRSRSSPKADSEFQQFSGSPQDTRQQPSAPSAHHASSAGMPQQFGGWATDFQRMQISSPSPVAIAPLQQQQTPQVHGHSWASPNWHEEFIQQNQNTTQASQMPGFQTHQQGMYGGYIQPGFGYSQPMHVNGEQGIQNQNAPEAFDEAAFEQAFANANAQLERQNQQLDAQVLSQAIEHVRHDELVEEKKEEPKDKQEDSDELSRTAGQLLDSLEGNTSRKFQESTFLALMRRLRDKEVKVEGDKMVENIQAPGEEQEVPAALLNWRWEATGESVWGPGARETLEGGRMVRFEQEQT